MADDLACVGWVLAVLRREGVPFDDAWAASFPRPQPSAERVNVRVALDATRRGWERSYNGEAPTRGESAVSLLVGLLAEHAEPEPVGDMLASRCG